MKKKILGWALLLIGAWCGVAGFLGMRPDQYKYEKAMGGFYGNDTHATVTKAFVWAAVLVIAGIIVLLIKSRRIQSFGASSYCSNCGTALYKSQKFCSSCGQLVTEHTRSEVSPTKSVKERQESTYIRDLLESKSLIQKVTSILLIAMYGLMSYQYLTVVAIGGSYSLKSYKVSINFIVNFLLFSLPQSWSLNGFSPEAEGGYWFLFSAIAFLVFFAALFIQKIKISAASLIMIFISAQVLQLIFFIMLYQGSRERFFFDIAISVAVSLTGIALFALLYWALLNPVDPAHIKSVALLAMIFAALFVIHDFISIYHQSIVQQESFGEFFDDYLRYLGDDNVIRPLPFLLIRCGFVMFYYNIYASLKKASLPQQENIQQMEATHGN